MGFVRYYNVGSKIMGEQPVGGARTDYLTDALGSVTATVDQAGVVQNTYRYKPYGEMLAKTGAATDPKFMWVGSEGYYQTGRDYSEKYVRGRHYSTTTANWTSTDPLGYDAGINLYCYVDSDPVNLVDPTGLQGTRPTPTPIPSPNCACGTYHGGPCAYAQAHHDNDGISGVVCCGGQLFACYWGNPDRRIGIKHCALEHERLHTRQPGGICYPSAAYGRQYSAPSRKNADECEANAAEIACLVSARNAECDKLKKPKGKECTDDYNGSILNNCSAMQVLYNCPHLPKECFANKK